jgi:Flp pilus assembly pilin Flp
MVVVTAFAASAASVLAATAIEYVLIAGTISIAILAAVDKIGTQLNTTFSTVWTAIK